MSFLRKLGLFAITILSWQNIRNAYVKHMSQTDGTDCFQTMQHI